jgi:hypothetical protein
MFTLSNVPPSLTSNINYLLSDLSNASKTYYTYYTDKSYIFN